MFICPIIQYLHVLSPNFLSVCVCLFHGWIYINVCAHPSVHLWAALVYMCACLCVFASYLNWSRFPMRIAMDETVKRVSASQQH